ncbi:hypothetical protein [Variovorax fucosicus]|uniref:hypothetical protein n=1 Tax=Variovorax fucosicus TaxID=3053517 RepID=UPI0025781BE3|nr:hypothetical protein [Variovorax sp. J22G47]MDM0054064.1 hypothetical protein [Variovorax sp. J22G47]
MQKELGTAGAAVGAFALACLFGGLTLAIYPGWPAIGSWLNRTDAPAWVQAVGSILAIAGAAYIAAWQANATRRDTETNRRRSETERALAISFILRRAELVVGNAARAVTTGSNRSMNLAYDQVEMVQAALRALPVFEIPSPRLVFDLQRTDRDFLYILRLIEEKIERNDSRHGGALFKRVLRRLAHAQFACVSVVDHSLTKDMNLTGIGPLYDEDDDEAGDR